MLRRGVEFYSVEPLENFEQLQLYQISMLDHYNPELGERLGLTKNGLFIILNCCHIPSLSQNLPLILKDNCET